MSELASGPGSLQPVDVGPMLPISQSSAVHLVGSAVSLPGRILSLWKSRGIRKKPRLTISLVHFPPLSVAMSGCHQGLFPPEALALR